MLETNLITVEAYYRAMNDKDLPSLEQYLHPNVRFIGPMAETRGKEALLGAAKKFMPLFNSLTIRAKFSSGNQVMLVYDWNFQSSSAHDI